MQCRSRLYESELQKRQAAQVQSASPKSQQVTGLLKSEPITIRKEELPIIVLTTYALDAIVGGDLGQVVDKLRMAEQAEKLAVMDGR